METYRIFYTNPDTVTVFAAQELKKYLRMLMPRCGEIPLCFDPQAKDGFRVGLFSDFGLNPHPVQDDRLDDVVYAKTDAHSGIIAGNNPRSILLSVYRFLRENGCRWLFPGPDGEVIPVQPVQPTAYCHAASYRYRGQCNEGSENQYVMMDAIDFTPKIGMNTFMQEFDIPTSYYSKYYEHGFCPDTPPESLQQSDILQWKRQCEAEITKRGLLYHDMGHGWTVLPFGLPGSGGWTRIEDDTTVLTEETRSYMAMVNGKRGLYEGIPLNTNVCFSNPVVRQKMVQCIADYAQTNTYVDFLHIWLADACNNHCECEACMQKPLADWYVLFLNEVDAELTRRQLDTHLVFIVYYDTYWTPVQERLAHPERFSMLFAPITRSYVETYAVDANPAELTPFVRNKLTLPKGMAANLAYLHAWKSHFSGDCFCYEYHFWIKQYADPGSKYMARIISEDIKGLQKHRLSGIVEDGSQRSAFPTGFPMYVYGMTLFDSSLSYEELEREYFSAAYGKNWQAVCALLNKLSDERIVKLMYGYLPKDSPEATAALAQFAACKEDIEAFRTVIAENRNSYTHASSVCWNVLSAFLDYCLDLLDLLEQDAAHHPAGVQAAFARIQTRLWPLERLYPGCYDHFLLCRSLECRFLQ